MPRTGRTKHVPQRTCIICRRKLAKRELNRIVKTPDGIVYDATGKMSGRGAYLCNNRDCWYKAIAGNALDRALNKKLSTEERTELRTEIDNRAISTTSNSPEA